MKRLAGKHSSECKYDTLDYYRLRVVELENDRNKYSDQSDYYQQELAKSHEILGRVIHQVSERWDSVNLTKYFPTDNLSRNRTLDNPTGKTIKPIQP